MEGFALLACITDNVMSSLQIKRAICLMNTPFQLDCKLHNILMPLQVQFDHCDPSEVGLHAKKHLEKQLDHMNHTIETSACKYDCLIIETRVCSHTISLSPKLKLFFLYGFFTPCTWMLHSVTLSQAIKPRNIKILQEKNLVS